MKYSFSNRHLQNNLLTYKCNIGDTWNIAFVNSYVKDKEWDRFDILSLSLVKKYKIDDNFLLNNVDKIEKMIFPFMKKEFIWTKKDSERNKELFKTYYEIFDGNIIIQQNDVSSIAYAIKIDVNNILSNITNKNKNTLEKILFLSTKKSKVNILSNMKFFSNIILYDGLPDITYVNNLRIFDNNKIEFLLSKKSWSKKNMFYTMNMEKILYYAFADYYTNYNHKIFSNEIIVKFLQGIFEKLEKDIKNKNEYFELINKIKQKLSYKENEFYKLIEMIILISLI